MTRQGYVHGYSRRESERLRDQAQTLGELLHHDTRFAPGATVIEIGSGVGAQTRIVAGRNPHARIVSMDIDESSLRQAMVATREQRLSNVMFARADLFHLPFGDESVDHVFVCFVLEHLAHPNEALAHLRRILKPGGRLTVIEGDHGSCCFHPHSEEASRNIACLVEAQARAGGNALIGRELYPLVVSAGFRGVSVQPRIVYADASRPEWVDGFTRRTFIAMVKGARSRAIELGLIDTAAWDAGIAALERTAGPDGTFSYTFYKAEAVK